MIGDVLHENNIQICTLSSQGFQLNRLEEHLGYDERGVPTTVLNINSTALLTLQNPSKYFEMHFHDVYTTLFYSEVPIAKGKVEDYIL